jgi:amino acid adenylation domain-containing protein
MYLSRDSKELSPTFKQEMLRHACAPDQGVMVSYTQESLWLLERMCTESGPAYNEPLAFHVRGQLQVDLLCGSLHRVVERHESLRTTFVETVAGLRAIVLDSVPEFVQVVDLRHLRAEEARKQADAILTDTYSRPFDLASGPLIRGIIVRLAEDEHVLGITLHHIVTDAWSMTNILDEVGRNYVALCRSGQLPDLPPTVQYSDYVLRLRAEYEQGAFDEKIEYWRRELQGAPELLNLPIDRLRPAAQTYRGSTDAVTIPRSKVSALIDKCYQGCGTTEFVTLLSAYAVLLSRYSGQDVVTIGTTVLNRDQYDYFGTVGCFVNTAALVFTIDGEMTFRELVIQAADRSIKMLQHQDAPYPKVLESLSIERDPSYNPVFQTMMTSLGKKPSLNLGVELACRPIPIKRSGTKYDLLMYVSDLGDDFEFEVQYNTDLFDRSTIKRMLQHYTHLLDQLAMDIDVNVSRVSILPDDEKRLMLDVWNDTRVDYPRTTVIDMFEDQSVRTPEAIAVEFNDRSLTYSELNCLANKVARFLVDGQGRRGEFVGVYMDRSIEMVVALVSIMKAGLAYVPIDPEYPSDRIRYMIEDSGISLIFTQERHREALTGVDAEIIVFSDLESLPGDATNVVRHLEPDSPVYMIYTSGSTGRPKGVVNRHESLFNRLYWMQCAYRLTSDDRVLQKTPFSFDVSVWEFFWPLMFGAGIVMAEPGGHRDPEYLKRVIKEKQINVIHFVPSMLNVFLEEDDLATYCGSLRFVFCSGEALPYTTVEKFHETLTCQLHNLYGPTEAAIDVSYWPCSRDYPGNVVPIGQPIANTRLYVLDKHMQIQPIGAPGELYIGGIALAKGYHNRDDLNKKAFVPDPFAVQPGARLYKTGDLARYRPDGQIQYLGRIDNQVKLRGFRIELGEIEAVVRRLPGVKDAAVVLHEAEDKRILCAYVVANNFDQQEAKDRVAEQLPEFMVPRIFVQIPRLLTTANGKLDRRRLPDPLKDLDVTESEAQPSTEEERVLLHIWREVLSQEQIGVDTNLFHLGGDSILSIRIAAQLRELGYHVQVHEIFANPTIRQLARKLTRAEQMVVTDPIATPFYLVDAADRRKFSPDIEDAWPLSMLQSGMIYHSMLHEGAPIYHDIFTFDIQAPVHFELLIAALRAVVAYRPQLRATFDLENFSRPLQLVYKELDTTVEIVDISHLSMPEQNESIDEWIATEKRSQFDFAQAPLFRVQIHIRSENEFNFALSFHHAILDGWSVALVLSDFSRAYADLLQGATITLKPEQVRYSTYVHLEQQTLRDPAHANFWLSKVSGVSPVPVFSAVQNTAERAPGVVASVEQVIPEHLRTALHSVARVLKLPFKSVLLALHLRVLGRLAGTLEVVSGLVVNGRPEMQGGEELAGLFLNTIPLRIELSPATWPSVFRRVFELEQEAMAHRRFPLAEILKRSGRKALFDVAFNYTDFHVYGQKNNNAVKILGARYFEQTNIPVVVHAHHDNFSNQIRLIVNYDVAQVDPDLILQYLNVFLEVAADVVSDKGVGGLPAENGGGEEAHPQVGMVTAGILRGRNAYVAPRTGLEGQIAEIVGMALGVEDIGIDDDFVRLGMDSIMAIRVVARIKRLGVKISIQDVFDKTTIRQLAEYGEFQRGSETLPARLMPFELVPVHERDFPTAVVDAYPATSMQLYMINRGRADVEQAVYHDVFAYHLALPLNEATLRDCLEQMTNDHETLRTAWALDGYSVPMQLVFGSIRPHLEIVDISFLPDEAREESFRLWFEREKRHGFDLSKPGLIRFYAHRYGPADFKLTLSFHHSILDGWSLSLFIQQLAKMYVASLSAGKVARPPLPALKYRDYVRIELESRSSDQLRSFWLNELHGYRYNSLLRRQNCGEGPRWSETKVIFDPAMQGALSSLANRLGVPLKHTLLAGHLVVMSLLCGETDVLTGVFSNGRPEEEEGENVLGMFLNFLPCRQEISGRTWRDLIRETFENDRRSMPYRRYPLASILDDLGRNRLFETAFNYTYFKQYTDIALVGKGSRNEQALKGVQWFEHTDFPLLVNVGHDLQTRLIITLNADGRVLSEQCVQIIGRMYEVVLARMTENEQALVADLPDVITELLAPLQVRE